MLAMKVTIGTKYACNLDKKGAIYACNLKSKSDYLCLQSLSKDQICLQLRNFVFVRFVQKSYSRDSRTIFDIASIFGHF